MQCHAICVDKGDFAVKLSEVTVKVTSIIENLDAFGLSLGDPERTESLTVGYYHVYDDGRRLVTYAESGEGGDVTTEIDIFGRTVTVSRRGAIESRMIFEEGRTHTSVYSIPPYRFDAEVRTRKITLELSEQKGRIEFLYNMKIGGAEKSARMKIWILPNSSQV